MKTLLDSVVLIFVVPLVSVAQAPHMITYQGFLADASGTPLSGLYDVTVSITDGIGSVKWYETHTDVPVEDGVFKLIIGSLVDLNASIVPGDRLLLSVEGEDLTPSSLLTSTPFALKSENAAQLGGVGADGYLRRNAEESTTTSTSDAVLRVENTGTGRGMTVISAGSHGLYGKSSSSLAGVEGEGAGTGPGIRGSSTTNHGTIGYSSASGKAGVFGNAPSGTGVWGSSDTGDGVYGYSAAGYGVFAKTIAPNENVPALYGRNEGNGNGIYGWSQNRHGVVGVTQSTATNEAGVFAANQGNGPAIYSDGALYVASGGVFIAGGDLHAQGAFTGNIGGDGAPFPRPAFDSGWIEVDPGADFWLGVGSTLPPAQFDNSNFVIDVTTKVGTSSTNQDVGGGVHYWLYSNNDIEVRVNSEVTDLITHVRLRVWYYR